MLPLIPLAISLAPDIAKWLFGPKAGDTATTVVNAIATATGTSDPDAAMAVIGRDPKVAADLKLQLAKIAAEAEQAARQADLDTLKALVTSDGQQVDLNKADAANPNLFIAGWRPFVGWTCGVGIAWAFVLSPFAGWLSGRPMPVVDVGNLLVLLQGLLGLAGLRTYEKIKGINAGR